MVDQHALGPTRRPGRVHQVREVVQARSRSVRPRPDAGVNRLGDREHQEPPPRGPRRKALPRQEDAGARVLQHVLEACRWSRGIDRDVRRARPQRAENGNDRLQRPAAGDRHAVSRLDAARQQRGRQRVGLLPQRRKRQRRRPLPHGDQVRAVGRARLEHRGHRLLRPCDRVSGIERGEGLMFLLVQDVHRGDRTVGVHEHGVEQRLEVTQAAVAQSRLERAVIEVEVQDVPPRPRKVVHLETKGVHAVAVSRVHPVDLGREPREGPKRGRYVVEDDVAGRGARWRAEAWQRVAQQEQGFLQAPGRQRPECVAGVDGHREREHLDEDAKRAPRLRRRPPVDRGIEAKVEAPADPMEPADEQRREQREPRHALRQARKSCLVAESVERARTGLVEFERQAGARRADGNRRAAVEGNRPARPLPARPPVFEGPCPRGRPDRQGGHGRIVGGQHWRPRAVAAQQARVLGTNLAVQHVG